MVRATGLLALLALSACGDGGNTDAPAASSVTSIKVANPYNDKLRALTQQNRDLALRRAIQDSGQTCKRITGSEETGTYKNMATWTAHCEGGRDWAIFIGPNGDTQVRSCADAQQLGLPGCSKSSN